MAQHIVPQVAHKIPLRKLEKRQHSWTNTDPQAHKLARRAWDDIQALIFPSPGHLV